MSETVQANDGTMLPLSSLAQEFTYSGTFVTSITVLYQGNTYQQTFLNDGTDITYISGWNNINSPQAQEIMTDESGNIMTDESGLDYMVTE